MFGIEDPSALLRPWRNLQQFTEELYAMLSRSGGDEQPRQASSTKAAQEQGPRPRRTASEPSDARSACSVRKARLEQARARTPSPEPARDSHAASRREQAASGAATAERIRREADQTDRAEPSPEMNRAPERRRPPEPRPQPRRQESASPDRERTSRPKADLKSLAAQAGSAFEAMTKLGLTPLPRREGNVFDQLDIGDFMKWTGGGTAGTTVFMGVVQSGSGDTYQVVLYQDGPKGDPDDSPVTVTIPMIDPAERIDPGTWLSGIHLFQDSDGNDVYSCQPPVWMP